MIDSMLLELEIIIQSGQRLLEVIEDHSKSKAHSSKDIAFMQHGIKVKLSKLGAGLLI